MLNFSQVAFSVYSNPKPILHNLNFSLSTNEFVIVLGANGSGKSSLLKLMSGDYIPSQGTIENRPKKIAYLSQDTADTLFHDLTTLENICLNHQKINPTPFRISTDSEETEYSNYLEEFHPHLPHKMDTLVGKLSGGERQSLALGLALKQNPDLLLLDEHTSALDPKTATAIMKLTQETIEKRSLTTVMVTHNLNHALECGTRLIALREGEIVLDVRGREKQGLKKQFLMEIYYDC